MKLELVATVLVVASLAGPVAADAGTRNCTVVAGTELRGVLEGPVRGSTGGPEGGVGECEVHVVQSRSAVTDVQTPDGCRVLADVDEDAFVEERVSPGSTYASGTVLTAFCEAGILAAENGVTMTPD